MDNEFYDLCYDAWMSCKNPDLVSEDRYDSLLSQGFYPDEISLKDIYPKQKQFDQESNELTNSNE